MAEQQVLYTRGQAIVIVEKALEDFYKTGSAGRPFTWEDYARVAVRALQDAGFDVLRPADVQETDGA